MICPHCRCQDQKKLWEDNLYWGCHACGWSSVGIINTTTTPSNARPPMEDYIPSPFRSNETTTHPGLPSESDVFWGDYAGD